MAKKKATGRLPGMEDADTQDVSHSLIEKGLEYHRAVKAETKAKGTSKDLFTTIKAQMKKEGIDKFWIETEGGKKRWLRLDTTEKLKWEDVIPKKKPADKK